MTSDAVREFVTDVHPRRIAGWSMMDRLPTDLALDAREMALRARERRAIASIGFVEDLYDNALAERIAGL